MSNGMPTSACLRPARPYNSTDRFDDDLLVNAHVYGTPAAHSPVLHLRRLPGGGMDLGESMADTVVREVKEETGIDVEVTGVVGIYTNPNHVMAYDDGEVRQQCSICFTTRMLGGQLATSSETSEVELSSRSGWTS
jgi:8-oxo-dGTP pyrophosphatase MutT (NUDIX family)